MVFDCTIQTASRRSRMMSPSDPIKCGVNANSGGSFLVGSKALRILDCSSSRGRGFTRTRIGVPLRAALARLGVALFVLKGHDKSAQGNALGIAGNAEQDGDLELDASPVRAPHSGRACDVGTARGKLRARLFRPFRARTLVGRLENPGRCPGLSCGCPCRGGLPNSTTSKLARWLVVVVRTVGRDIVFPSARAGGNGRRISTSARRSVDARRLRRPGAAIALTVLALTCILLFSESLAQGGGDWVGKLVVQKNANLESALPLSR